MITAAIIFGATYAVVALGGVPRLGLRLDRTGAAVVGAAVGLGLAVVAGQAIDLAALTGLLHAGGSVSPDITGTAAAAAGVVAVVIVAVGIAVAANRRARLGAVLRAGERS